MSAPAPPWYREPWVWFLIAIPFSSVVMGVVMVVLAVRSDDGLVADDYYRRGLEINRVLARDETAARLGLSARVKLSTGGVTVSLDGHGERGAGAAVLRLAHPTRAGLDRTLALIETGPGRYAGEGVILAPGRWHVLLESEAWRLSGRIDAPGSGQPVTLAPDPG